MAWTFLATAVDVSPTAGTWTDVDASAYVSAQTKAVILRVVHTNTNFDREAGFRKNGSTDTIKGDVDTGGHYMIIVPVDGSQIFECNIDHSDIQIWLAGYIEKAQTFTNAITATPGASGWQDWDISSHTGPDTAVAAFGRFGPRLKTCGVRKNGSTDADTIDVVDDHFGWFCGVDGSEILEISSNATDSPFHLDGYFVGSDGVVAHTNTIDATPAISSTWTDHTLGGGSNAGVGILYFRESGGNDIGLRKNGSASAILNGDTGDSAFLIAEADAGGVVEIYAQSTAIVKEFGYVEAASQAQTKTVTGSLSALIRKTETLIGGLDTRLQRRDIAGTAMLDGLLQQQGLVLGAGFDALLTNARALTVAVGALLRKTETRGAALDGLLQRAVNVAAAADALLRKQGLAVGTDLDALLVRQQQRAAGLDGLLMGRPSRGASLDAILSNDGDESRTPRYGGLLANVNKLLER